MLFVLKTIFITILIFSINVDIGRAKEQNSKLCQFAGNQNKKQETVELSREGSNNEETKTVAPFLIDKILDQSIIKRYKSRLDVYPKYTKEFIEIGRVLKQLPQPGDKMGDEKILKIWVGKYFNRGQEKRLLAKINRTLLHNDSSEGMKKLLDNIRLTGPIEEKLEEKSTPYGNSSRWISCYKAHLAAVKNHLLLFSLFVEAKSDPRVRQEIAKKEAEKRLIRQSHLKVYQHFQNQLSNFQKKGLNKIEISQNLPGLLKEGQSMLKQVDKINNHLDLLIESILEDGQRESE